jgi:hypothetical protein
VAVSVREGIEHGAFNDAEHGGGRTNAQLQRQYGKNREGGILCLHPYAKLHTLKQGLH